MNCLNCHHKNCKKCFLAGGTEYYRCEKCTLVFTDRLATTEYSSYHRFKEYQRWEPYLKNHFSWIARQISSLNKGRKRILEIGCSVGYLLDVLRSEGHLVEGVEPSQNAAEFARSRGHKVIHGYFEETKIKNHRFDVIVANHVFEHIKNPRRFLLTARKLLSEDSGYLVLLVPNFGSLEAQLLKKHWRFLIENEHYMQYTPVSIANVLSRNGFIVKSIKTTSVVTGLGDYKKELLRCLLSDWKRLIFYVIESPWALFQQFFNKGTNLLVIAQPVRKNL